MGGLDCRVATDGTNLAARAMRRHGDVNKALIGAGSVHGRRILSTRPIRVKPGWSIEIPTTGGATRAATELSGIAAAGGYRFSLA